MCVCVCVRVCVCVVLGIYYQLLTVFSPCALWRRSVSCHVRADDAEDVHVVSNDVCSDARSRPGVYP